MDDPKGKGEDSKIIRDLAQKIVRMYGHVQNHRAPNDPDTWFCNQTDQEDEQTADHDRKNIADSNWVSCWINWEKSAEKTGVSV